MCQDGQNVQNYLIKIVLEIEALFCTSGSTDYVWTIPFSFTGYDKRNLKL